MNKIPNDGNPIGPDYLNYVRKGLVLQIDALKPRRNGTMPDSSNLWEDLSDNRYDLVCSNGNLLFGKKYVNLKHDYGTRLNNDSFPVNPQYTVEICGNLCCYAMAFYIFEKADTINYVYNRIDLRDSYDVTGIYVKRDGYTDAKKYQCPSRDLASFHISPSIVTRNNEELEGVVMNAASWSGAGGGATTIARGIWTPQNWGYYRIICVTNL